MTDSKKVYCPECGTAMFKSGSVWSGRKKVRRWQCSKCGRTTTQPVSSIGQTEERKVK